ncbi:MULTISPECIES: hypothetical protein [Vibrio]|uniref:hypothetical protein n=1 Tax=Vibrio TaxID=662 RepID=UPI000E0ACAF4|nr:hypothetical protein [Vibrio tetraodonis]
MEKVQSNLQEFFSVENRSMMGGWTIDRDDSSETNVAEFFSEENRSMMGGWTIDRDEDNQK